MLVADVATHEVPRFWFGLPELHSEQPRSIRPARDKRNNPIPGRDYEFSNRRIIREHWGHDFPDDPLQNGTVKSSMKN